MAGVSTTISTIYNCTLERAFRSPMLCDVTKVHTGWGFMPKVTHCTEDATWGQVGGSRKVFMKKTLLFKGGESGLDTVLERVENKYWKIEIGDLKYFAVGFKKFVGEWETKEVAPDSVQIIYTYTLYANNVLWLPLHWLIVKTFWRMYMKHVLENVRQLAYANAPYTHS